MPSNITIDPLIPGSDLLEMGLADIQSGHITEYALLLYVAQPRLARLGIVVPPLAGVKPHHEEPYEHQLYALLDKRGGYSAYNSLLRRMSSFARCLERERGALAHIQALNSGLAKRG
jgi:hypothetical protein